MVARTTPIGDNGRRAATNIRHLRTRRGITQTQLAERLAAAGHPIPLARIQRVEYGERRLDPDDVAGIAAVFAVDPGSLAYSDTPVCVGCRNEPPAGFTCNACGNAGTLATNVA